MGENYKVNLSAIKPQQSITVMDSFLTFLRFFCLTSVVQGIFSYENSLGNKKTLEVFHDKQICQIWQK